MEFYETLPIEQSAENCFNSQRDGILPKQKRQQKSFKLFQFPTGWNSTLRFLAPIIARGLVSIPNGMEFYSIRI